MVLGMNLITFWPDHDGGLRSPNQWFRRNSRLAIGTFPLQWNGREGARKKFMPRILLRVVVANASMDGNARHQIGAVLVFARMLRKCELASHYHTTRGSLAMQDLVSGLHLFDADLGVSFPFRPYLVFAG